MADDITLIFSCILCEREVTIIRQRADANMRLPVYCDPCRASLTSKENSRDNAWTEEKDALLRQLCERSMTDAMIGECLRKTATAVRQRRIRLRILKQGPMRYSEDERNKIAELKKLGLTLREISLKMPERSRCSVAGYLHRNKLKNLIG